LLAIPSPWQPKARVAFRKDGILKVSGLPRATTISTHFDLRHFPAAAPREPSNLMKARVDLLLTGWIGDHRLRLHHQTKLIGFAVGHEIRILGRFPARHEWRRP